MKVSIVLPAYNEAGRLKQTVERVQKAAEETGYDYEIIIAEDGSEDGTDAIAREIAESNPKVIHLHSDERLGRGKALMNAFEKAEGDIVVYMDVDLATDLRHLKEIVDAIAREGYDLATGSRLMKSSDTDRPAKREIASRGYNFLVRLFLGSKIRDHQCGFKAFKKSVVMEIGKRVRDNHWFWDTEVLVLAQKMGYRVKEIPVRWRHGGETKVEFGRDVTYMFSQILRMWLDEKKKSKKYLFITTLLAVAILAAIALKVGVENVYHNLLSLNLYYVVAASALYSASYLLRGFRFKYIIDRLGYNHSTAFSTAAVSISQTVNVLTPVRIGDFARAYVFRRKEVPYSVSIGGIAAERVYDLISVALIALVAALLLGSGMREPVYAFLFALIIFLGIFGLSRMENVLGRVFKNARRVMGVKEGLVLTVLSLLLWFSDIAVCYIVSMSFGSPDILLISLAVAVGNIVKALPVTPGGVGTYEAALTAILSTSYPTGTAFIIALVDHAVKNITTLILGMISLGALNLSLKEVEGQE
ncbi:flippase-like domain-containing protein [Archaeoglobus neptunius]|uniref:flippase-like domain-containing protein n=1 Tax=Archaeoglobus neptunius TaxID=2798580 RepID=UPI001E55AD40|nr:flippase-like domain-containing protein [Archaeoglobus neptunius]